MNSTELKRAKRRVRNEVLAVRDAVPPQRRRAMAERVADRFMALPEVVEARIVMAFWSFGSELPTMPLIERLLGAGVGVALPRIDDGELQARTWAPGEPMTETTFGAREPAAGAMIDLEAIDVVATPAVAFDRTGRRVGYGGGFYDRFFPRTRGDALRAGVGLGVQLLDEALPGGPFDLRVDVVVTESETVRCRVDP